MDLLLHFGNVNSFVNQSFPRDLQSWIELNDIHNALSTRSCSQILVFSLINIGDVILPGNFLQSLYDFVQLHLNDSCKKVERHFVFYFDP